ncbi:MAG: DUF3822 family protein [Bacteroidales bacterium]|nr:DUF3822 family protein [Bacteroidales bacterium]
MLKLDSFQLVDETCSVQNTKNYNLSILINRDGFYFCILDVIKNKYVLSSYYSNPLSFDEQTDFDWIKKIFNKDKFLRNTYNSVKIGFISQKSTIVPSSLFKIENISEYLYFNHEPARYEIIKHNYLRNINAYNIFSIPIEINEIFTNYFTEINYYHQSTPFIECNLLDNKNKLPGKKMYICSYCKFIDILVIDKNNLIFYNSFKYKNSSDFIYFVFNVLEQLKIDPKDTETILSGDILSNSDIYKLLKQYIKNVKFDKLNKNFNYSYTFNEKPLHFFTNLFNLERCV